MDAIVRLEGITVDFGEGHGVFELDLEVGAGERVAIIGPSGAGKSTALQLINGLVMPSSGKAFTLGMDTTRLVSRSGQQTRQRIGTIHQSLNLASALRVVHNVSAGRLGRWSTAKALGSLLRPQDVLEVREALEQVGIANLIWTRTDKLSGGQRQRVAAARLLLQNPDLVLADEPVSSLDPGHSQALMQLLIDTVTGSPGRTDRTLIMSLHDPDLARTYADRIIGLNAGRIEFDVPSEDVTDEVLENLYKVPTRSVPPATNQ